MTAVVYKFDENFLDGSKLSFDFSWENYIAMFTKKTHIYELKQIVIVWKNLNWKQQQEQCTVRWKFILLFITSQ